MPKLTPLELGFTQQQLEEVDFRPYAVQKRSHFKIKAEADAEQDIASPVTDWIKIYECVLSTITSSQSTLRFGRDATGALQRLEAILQVAETLQAIPALESALQSHILDWVSNKSLYQAIADQPPSWLLVGCTLQQNLIYKEAFSHIAGVYPDWPWSKSQSALPPAVLASIATSSKDLRTLRDRIDNELLLLWPTKNKFFVTQNTSVPDFFTANRFQAWVRDHLTFLQQDEVGLAVNSESSVDPNKSTTCNHTGQCRTVGGFYRTIAAGGDTYLPADETAAWLVKMTGCNGKEAAMRKCLADLKAQAARIVAPLVESAMQFSQVEKLEYLTCVEARAEDLPWSEGQIEGSENEDEDMEER